jgi:predicted Fe-Mo cluster-binding NifX family protein
MKIAIPTAEKKLCMHFGHCDEFAIFEVNKEEKKVTEITYLAAPPHQPGLLPKWMSEKDVNCIIAGGIGIKAQNLFKEFNIEVVSGATGSEPEQIVRNYLDGTLVTGQNTCSH